MITEILLNIVYELNSDFYEQTNMDECCPFKISSNGDWVEITFMNEFIWGSENDPREYADGDYEPLDKYLRKTANKMVYELLKLKF